MLMIGGNIPGETKVLSIAIYDHVESLEFFQTHILAGHARLSFLSILTLAMAERKLRSPGHERDRRDL